MDFKRWLGNNDTPQWKRAASGFLMVATVVALIGVLFWWLLSN